MARGREGLEQKEKRTSAGRPSAFGCFALSLMVVVDKRWSSSHSLFKNDLRVWILFKKKVIDLSDILIEE